MDSMNFTFIRNEPDISFFKTLPSVGVDYYIDLPNNKNKPTEHRLYKIKLFKHIMEEVDKIKKQDFIDKLLLKPLWKKDYIPPSHKWGLRLELGLHVFDDDKIFSSMDDCTIKEPKLKGSLTRIFTFPVYDIEELNILEEDKFFIRNQIREIIAEIPDDEQNMKKVPIVIEPKRTLDYDEVNFQLVPIYHDE